MAEPLDTLTHPRLIRKTLTGARAMLLADATGLDAAARDQLEADLKRAALDLPGVEEVMVGLSAGKVHQRIIAIGSGKGGVGKSTLTANLAVALARLGHKVGVIDADIYGPSQPTLLAAPQKPEAKDKQLRPVASPHGVSLLSVGQLVSAGTALAWRGPMASGALKQLIDGDWEGHDLILIDLPPGTGDVQLSLIREARPLGAVIVSTPQDLALIDATRAADLFTKTQVPILGMVENMAGYDCPHCGKSSDPFGQGGAQDAAAAANLPFLGRLPLSASLRAASDAGDPPAAGDGPAAKAFEDLARALMVEVDRISA